MAKKRQIKRDVHMLTNELIEEVKAYKRFHPEADESTIEEILNELESSRLQLIKRVNNIKVDKSIKPKTSMQGIVKDLNSNILLLDKLKNE
jgi:hypothetical protein